MRYLLSRTVTILDCDFGSGEIEREILEPLGYHVVVGQAHTEAEVLEMAAGSAGLLTQYAPITRTVLETTPELRAVVRYGVGVDCIDTVAARDLGVSVSGVQDYCTDEVADHAMALLLTAVRSTHVSDREIKAGLWPVPASLPLMQPLSGKKLGLLGFGRIAQSVAKRARAFGCVVVAHDPFVDAAVLESTGVLSVGFDEVLESSILSLHLPVTSETIHILDAAAIRRLPHGAIVVNVSRGALIDESALRTALDEGRIAVACLDVFEFESAGSDLAQHPKVVATPHSAYYSPRALNELRRRAATSLAALMREPSA